MPFLTIHIEDERMKKRVKLELWGSEAYLVINALDFYSRIWIGQYDHIMYEMRWQKDCGKLDAQENKLIDLFKSVRQITLPELALYGFSGSHGIFSEDRDVRAAIAYDLQQEIRYKKAWFEYPAGGYTVDFGTPLPCEDDPYPFPKAACRKEGEETIVYMEVVAAQAKIIVEALEIRYCLENNDFAALFAHYTENEQALGYAEQISEIYSAIPESRYYYSRTDVLRNLADRTRKQLSGYGNRNEFIEH